MLEVSRNSKKTKGSHATKRKGRVGKRTTIPRAKILNVESRIS